MKRPIGLILSAIVLSLAALFLLLMTALMAFAGLFAGHQPTVPAAPHFLIYFMLAISVFYAVLAVWAILTVIGILRLRSWARYSILIIGGGLAVLGILTALFTLVGRSMLPNPTGSAAGRSILTSWRSSSCSWRSSIYSSPQSASGGSSTSTCAPSASSFANPNLLLPVSDRATGRFSRTPTAIKIIGWLLPLLFRLLSPRGVPALPRFLPRFHPSAVRQPTSSIYALLPSVRLRRDTVSCTSRSRPASLTIGFHIFGCCNIGSLLLPWYQAQFRLYMTQTLFLTCPRIPGQPQIFLTYSAGVLSPLHSSGPSSSTESSSGYSTATGPPSRHAPHLNHNARALSRLVSPQHLHHPAVLPQRSQSSICPLRRIEPHIHIEHILPRTPRHRPRLDLGQIHSRPPPAAAAQPPASPADAQSQKPGSSCSHQQHSLQPARPPVAADETACSSPHGPQSRPPAPPPHTRPRQAQAQFPPASRRSRRHQMLHASRRVVERHHLQLRMRSQKSPALRQRHRMRHHPPHDRRTLTPGIAITLCRIRSRLSPSIRTGNSSSRS